MVQEMESERISAANPWLVVTHDPMHVVNQRKHGERPSPPLNQRYKLLIAIVCLTAPT